MNMNLVAKMKYETVNQFVFKANHELWNYLPTELVMIAKNREAAKRWLRKNKFFGIELVSERRIVKID